MTQAEMRQIALQATRGKARHQGFDPVDLTAESALEILDDLLRKDPELIACRWYGAATDSQINLFKREWRAWVKRALREGSRLPHVLAPTPLNQGGWGIPEADYSK